MRKSKKVGIPFRTLIALLSVALLFGGAIGGTFAWLTSTPTAVVNTFTVGSIKIELKESPLQENGYTVQYTDAEANWNSFVYENKYKFIPGIDLGKNPTVKVFEGNEPCYLFIKVDETNWPNSYVTYSVDTGWSKLNGQTGVWYKELDEQDEDLYVSVLDGNKITVNANFKNTNVPTPGTDSKLTFTAYAIQQAGFNGDISAAWTAVQAAANP